MVFGGVALLFLPFRKLFGHRYFSLGGVNKQNDVGLFLAAHLVIGVPQFVDHAHKTIFAVCLYHGGDLFRLDIGKKLDQFVGLAEPEHLGLHPPDRLLDLGNPLLGVIKIYDPRGGQHFFGLPGFLPQPGAGFLHFLKVPLALSGFFLRLRIGEDRLRALNNILIVAPERGTRLFHAIKGFVNRDGSCPQALENVENGLESFRRSEHIPKSGITEKPYLLAYLCKLLFGLVHFDLSGGLGLLRHFLGHFSHAPGGVCGFLRRARVFVGQFRHHALVGRRLGRQIGEARSSRHEGHSPRAAEEGNKTARSSFQAGEEVASGTHVHNGCGCLIRSG